MTLILDHVASRSRGDFRPSNPDEFFALRLATRLGAPQTSWHLALLASEHGVEKLIAVFHRTMALALPREDLVRRFHKELTHSRNGARSPYGKLVGIRVERRCVGTAIF